MRRIRSLLRRLDDPYLLVYDLLRKSILTHASVVRGNTIDLGCGDWRISSTLAPMVDSVSFYGIDNWLPTNYHTKAPVGAQFWYASIIRTPFHDNCFDTAILTDVLEHVVHPDLVVAEAFRILKPSGCLLLSVPFFLLVHGAPNDYQRFTIYGLVELLHQAGFRIEAYTPIGSYPLTVLSTVTSVSGFRRIAGRARFGESFSARILATLGLYLVGRYSPKIFNAPMPAVDDRSCPTGLVVVARKTSNASIVNEPERTRIEPVCPLCHGTLRFHDDCIECMQCREMFQYYNGVPILAKQEDLHLLNETTGQIVDLT